MGKRRKISKTKYVKTGSRKKPSKKEEPEEEPEEVLEEERPIPAPLRQSPDVKIFVAEPMINKPVTDISGIGFTLGRKLALSGFDKAYVVLGQYLVLKKNRRLFIKWLRDEFNAPVKCARDCYTCLSEWCNAYL